MENFVMYSKEITFETNEQVPTTFIFYKNSYSVNLGLLRPLIQEVVEEIMKNKNNETIILFRPPQLLIFKIFSNPPPPPYLSHLFPHSRPTLPSTKTFNLRIIFLNVFLENGKESRKTNPKSVSVSKEVEAVLKYTSKVRWVITILWK